MKNIILLGLGLFIIGVLYSRYLWNKRKALLRLYQIKFLWSFSDGNEHALHLYDEARGLWRYYDFTPEDFGFIDWDHIQSAAGLAMQIYIDHMTGLLSEETQELMKLRQQLHDKQVAEDDEEQMRKLSSGVVRLECVLIHARERLVAFQEAHRAPQFT